MNALEKIKEIKKLVNADEMFNYKAIVNYYCDGVKEALLKAQKEHNVLEIIKKFIWVEDGKLKCGRYADIEIELEEEDFENKEEFYTLKEILE